MSGSSGATCFGFCFLSLLAAGCVKTPTILRGGVEMPVEQAARLDWEEGEAFFGRKQYAEASKRYQGIVSQMPTASYADNALLRLAQIQRARKNLKEAADLLESLVARYPAGDAVDEGKEELGKLLYVRKEYDRAAEMFAAMDCTKVNPSRLVLLEEVARSAFERADAPRGKLRFLISLHDATAPHAKRLALQSEITDLLDRTADRSDLEQLVGIRKASFPAGQAAFKLAKLAHHEGDLRQARRWISVYLNQFRDLEYTREAVELSLELDRGYDVNARSVGLLLPVKGNNRLYATQVLRGAALAMNLFGSPERGGAEIEFFIEDTSDDPEAAAAALEKLVRDRKIIAAIGPLFAKQSQTAAMAATHYGLPLISFSAAEGVTEIGPTIFRNSLTKSAQAEALASISYETLSLRRVAILYPENNYGTEFMTLFWEAFARRGGEIRGAESYDPESNDFSLPLKKLVGLEPDQGRSPPAAGVPTDFEALFVPDNFDKAMQIAPALAYYGIRGVMLLGTNLWNNPDILKGGDKGGYFQGSVFLDSFFKNRADPAVARFVERFYAVFGEEPGIFEAQAYDTVSVLLSVLLRDRPSSREDLARALSRVRDFPGVTGALSFGEKREALRPLTALTVDDGRIVELR